LNKNANVAMPSTKLEPLLKATDYGKLFGQLLQEVLPKMNMKRGPWIAGGAVRRLFEGQKDYTGFDIDIWFRNESQLDDAVKHILSHGGGLIYDTDNALTYKLPFQGKDIIIQLIRYDFYNSPREIINSFDFKMSQCLTDGISVLMGDETKYDISNKRLTLRDIPLYSSVSTIRRIGKFMAAGYKITNADIAKLLRQVIASPESIDAVSISDDSYEQQ
jgi:hypothetical protein